MKLKIAIVAVMAAIFMPYGIALADGVIQYVWVLSESKQEILTNGESFVGYSCGEGRVFNQAYGGYTTRGVTTGCLSTATQYDCVSTICAFASYRYVKNDELEFTSGNGITYSNTIIKDMDSRPMLAFSQSSIVLQAGISGYVDNPFIKSMVVTMIGISIAVYTFKSTWRILDVFKKADKDEETLETSANHSIYSDDSVSDGHE